MLQATGQATLLRRQLLLLAGQASLLLADCLEVTLGLLGALPLGLDGKLACSQARLDLIEFITRLRETTPADQQRIRPGALAAMTHPVTP